ncbi:MAG: nucleotidyltransferase domain-containing protein [Deltaproteobacteria bacterium]|nr:nucleotidyltransferase domain-containing protein [Deltaproteobacteria bacterium]MBW2340225.1 nucleotidyltransferase domain-containing protein [Deltaproteobacteria bacterium]
MDQTKSHHISKYQRREIGEKITAVLTQRHEIVFAFLYGSFLSETRFRDIDLGIFVRGLDHSEHWDYECKLSQEIENALHSSFLFEVKVINEAPLSFCFHVIMGKLLFTKDEDFLVDFMIRTARHYLDVSPLRQRYIIEAMA